MTNQVVLRDVDHHVEADAVFQRSVEHHVLPGLGEVGGGPKRNDVVVARVRRCDVVAAVDRDPDSRVAHTTRRRRRPNLGIL